jgi:hypothetical protein
MKRYGTLEEQAAPILFLASDEASYITGTILPVAGGLTVPAILTIATIRPVATVLPVEARPAVAFAARFEGLGLGCKIPFLAAALALLERLFVALVLESTGLVSVLLAQGFLSGRDDADVMLGVLIVIFGRYRIAARMRISRELAIFLGNMLRRATDLDVRAVRFVAARQGIGSLAAAAAIVAVSAPAAHAPVLSWSHYGLRPSLVLPSHAMQANVHRTGLSPAVRVATVCRSAMTKEAWPSFSVGFR